MDLHDVLMVLHVAAGAAGLAVGARLILLSRDRPLLDRSATGYHWAVAVVAVTSAGLVAFDWPDLWWLLLLAVLTWALAATGHAAPVRRFRGWSRAYVHGVGGSYIALVTALLVVSLTVDGPVDWPASVLVWGLPTAIGTVLIAAWHRRLTS
ncbi:MAG TPA: hypothetical protein VFM58_19400 [Solirubrobacteraceae bacterium]|nr:hypothetical protein [Solirubrobacteraceae bacterium]